MFWEGIKFQSEEGACKGVRRNFPGGSEEEEEGQCSCDRASKDESRGHEARAELGVGPTGLRSHHEAFSIYAKDTRSHPRQGLMVFFSAAAQRMLFFILDVVFSEQSFNF